MTEVLDQAIARLQELCDEDQDALASALLALVGGPAEVTILDADTRAAVEEGLAQAVRGEFVPDEEVTRANLRRGLF